MTNRIPILLFNKGHIVNKFSSIKNDTKVILVGAEDGIYLSSDKIIVHANGCNPNDGDDFEAVKRQLLLDQSLENTIGHVENIISLVTNPKCKKHLCIHLGKNALRLSVK